jgi:hypothetical protein
VCDDHGAAPATLLGDGGGDAAGSVPILAGRGLVEDENWGAGRHRRGDGDETLGLRREIAGVRALEMG